MRDRLSKSLAIVSTLLGVPAASHAASVVFTYEPVVEYSSSPLFTTSTSVAVGVGNTVVVPQNVYFRVALRATVTGNANSTTAVGNGLLSGYVQPALLGLGAFGETITSDTPSAVTPRSSGGSSTATINTLFASVKQTGLVNASAGTVGIGMPGDQLSGGILGGTIDGRSASSLLSAQIGTTGTATVDDVYTGLQFRAVGIGTAKLTASIPTDTVNFVIPDKAGNTDPDDPVAETYTNRNYNAGGITDSLTGPGNLNVTVTPEPSALAVMGAVGSLCVRRRRQA